jgi:hypothetical protein
MNIVHDDHSHVGALTEGGNHDVMVCKVRHDEIIPSHSITLSAFGNNPASKAVV